MGEELAEIQREKRQRLSGEKKRLTGRQAGTLELSFPPPEN